jgi:chlorobactene glucosyltransferase
LLSLMGRWETTVMALPIGFVAGISLLIIFWIIDDWQALRDIPRIKPQALPDAPLPRVSLLIPARNEEHNIGRCVQAALAQDYPNLEVLVVDDASTDGTAAVLAGFDDPRLRVLPGRPLPPGWAGKPNVCQQLADAATGDWLLFLDADTVAQPGLVQGLLAYVQNRQVDLLTILPHQTLGSFWERVILPQFLTLILAVYPLYRISRTDARPDEVLAFGYCLMVQRDAYDAVGGHAAVAHDVLEDVRLAQALRHAGYRIDVADGREYLSVRMYTSGQEVVAGLHKNAAAGSRSGGTRSQLAALRLMLQAFGPLWLIAWGGLALAQTTGPVAWGILGLGLLSMGLAAGYWAALLVGFYRLPLVYVLFWPFGLMAYLLIALRGMWHVHIGRGVVWKGRRYAG